MNTFIIIILIAIYIYNQSIWSTRYTYFQKTQNNKFCRFIIPFLNESNYDFDLKILIKQYLFEEHDETIAFVGSSFLNETDLEYIFSLVTSNYTKLVDYYDYRCDFNKISTRQVMLI